MGTRDLVLVSLFAAIIVVLGLIPSIPVGIFPVPITLQSLGVMLAGVVLGARRGTAAVLLVLVLVAIGLPVLSGGRGGLGAFAAPTTGFLIGWVAGAFITGFVSERLVSPSQSSIAQTAGFFLAAILGGIGAVYLFGILWLALVSGLGLPAAFLGSLIFVPGDCVKALIAALAGRAVLAGYPLLPVRA